MLKNKPRQRMWYPDTQGSTAGRICDHTPAPRLAPWHGLSSGPWDTRTASCFWSRVLAVDLPGASHTKKQRELCQGEDRTKPESTDTIPLLTVLCLCLGQIFTRPFMKAGLSFLSRSLWLHVKPKLMRQLFWLEWHFNRHHNSYTRSCTGCEYKH